MALLEAGSVWVTILKPSSRHTGKDTNVWKHVKDDGDSDLKVGGDQVKKDVWYARRMFSLLFFQNKKFNESFVT